MLFNPETRNALLRRTAGVHRLLCIGGSILSGALVGGFHYSEEPFLAYLLDVCAPEFLTGDCGYSHWLDVVAGIAATIVFGAIYFVIYRLRRLQPTVFCRNCGGAGWIEDLRARAGRCPRCGHGRFRFRGREIEIEGNAFTREEIVVRSWDEDDVAGEDLLALKSAKGTSLN